MPGEDGELLSDTAMHYMAGLLEHARASSVLTTPTINGYKRYIANSVSFPVECEPEIGE